jgi:hypothetical protein
MRLLLRLTGTYKAWQAIGFDASEWLVPGQRVKIKFILYMDLATKLKVIHLAKEYSFVEMKNIALSK